MFASYRALPFPAQIYVGVVITGGTAVFAASVPRALPHPWLFAALVAASCLTSMWKVRLPVKATGSTLSFSYAANLTTLLVLGPRQAVMVAVAGTLVQCHFRAAEPASAHRTVFSMAATSLTMAATGIAYTAFGGVLAPTTFVELPRPLVSAIAVYFIVNTTLVAAAIAMATKGTLGQTWRLDYLWSGASFIVAGTAGAIAAVVIARGEYSWAALLVAPVYLTYRTYRMFVGRLADERRHAEEAGELHQQALRALTHAHEAERALADEKERLATTLAEMTRLQEIRTELLHREQLARAQAEDASRIKDQFLAVVSHELRTPLSAILGWSDMLRRGVLEPPVHERAVRSIYDSARRQAELIDDLLDVARITAGKLRLDRVSVDLRGPVRDALQVVQPGSVARGVRLVIDIDSAPLVVTGDPARLQQIAWNLLSNALKFTPEGGAVTLTLRRAGPAAELTVADTGRGIAPDFLPRVFDAFRQADASTTRVQPGLGLGLSIVKSLVEAHGGSVQAHSSGEGLGATFVARFPLVAVAEPRPYETPPLADAWVPPLAPLAGVAVLVVDDDAGSREVIAESLTRCRARVLTAESAASAFDLLNREPIDVLLADIGMPGEDGYALLRRIRSCGRPDVATIPAAALTAFARDEDRRNAYDAGFDLHLAKPIEPHLLATAVWNLHRQRAAHT